VYRVLHKYFCACCVQETSQRTGTILIMDCSMRLEANIRHCMKLVLWTAPSPHFNICRNMKKVVLSSRPYFTRKNRLVGPPVWFRGQSSWLQIQRSGFVSRRYQIFWEVVGLERGPLSLVSKTLELLERKSSGSGLENRDYGRRGSSALTKRHSSIRESWH
jgi:hypothetical protein